MIEINYWAILLCGVVSMGIGALWYGPMFGAAWMRIVGATNMDREARKKMQKEAGPLYGIQLLLSLFQAYVLAWYIASLPGMSGAVNALWIWAAFIMPTLAGASMWTNEARKTAWARFLIQAGYQVVNIVVFGLILSLWK